MCLPGMNCYEEKLPHKCGDKNKFYGYPINTNLLCYAGPVLTNTNINSADSLSVAFQKIDYKLTPTTIAEDFFAAITNNLSLKNMFDTFVNNAITTTAIPH